MHLPHQTAKELQMAERRVEGRAYVPAPGAVRSRRETILIVTLLVVSLTLIASGVALYRS